MKKLAVESEAAAVEQEKRSAAGMSPAQCVALLNKERYRLKLDADDKIQIAPADRVDRRIRALVWINQAGLLELLRAQQDFAPLDAA